MSIIFFGLVTQVQLYLLIIIVFIYILFDSYLLKFIFSSIVVFTYLGSFYYMEYNDPMIPHMRFPFDSYLNFGLGLLSSAMLSNLIYNHISEYINQIIDNNKMLVEVNKELAEQKHIIEGQKEELELFTSMASHDLKTPIRTLNGFLDLLGSKMEKITDEKTIEYFSFAKSGSKQLEKLIEGISSYKKIGNDVEEISSTKTDEVVRFASQVLNHGNTKDIEIVISSLMDLKIKESHLQHLFMNIFENGLKYNESEIKRINVTDELAEGYYKISICDNGIGIEEKYFDYVLKPFKKLHPAHIYEGSGMGLSICQKIITLYSGKIEIKSNGTKGTCFILSFPDALINKNND